MVIYIFNIVHGVVSQRNVQKNIRYLQLSFLEADYGRLPCFVLPFRSVNLNAFSWNFRHFLIF